MPPSFRCLEQVVNHIRQARPELESVLPKAPDTLNSDTPRKPLAKIDTSPAEQELGLKFRDWKSSIEEVVDALLRVKKERGWK